MGNALLGLGSAVLVAALGVAMTPAAGGAEPSPFWAAVEDLFAGAQEVLVTGLAPGDARAMSLSEARELLERSVPGPGANGPVPVTRCSDPPVYCGPDLGSSPVNSGPFCSDLGGWIAFTGPPGTSSVISVGPAGPATCFWEGTAVENVVLSPLAVAAQGGAVVYEGCYATNWLIHSNGYCPNPFSAGDTFLTTWQMRGTGVLLRIEAGGTVLEFVGGSGWACYDLPTVPGVAGFC